MKQIVIYGGGGFAREVAWLVQSSKSADGTAYEIMCFADDNTQKQGTILNKIPVMSLEDARARFPEARIVGAIGSPQVREKIMVKAAAAGFLTETIIHPNVEHAAEWNEYGDGTVICAGSILTVNITLKKHVQINLDCTIGHDVIMGDYSTLAPGVHISGWVHMGSRVYIGTGASIINGNDSQPLTIADDVVIGAGACVTKSISEPGITVVGIPAKPLQR